MTEDIAPPVDDLHAELPEPPGPILVAGVSTGVLSALRDAGYALQDLADPEDGGVAGASAAVIGSGFAGADALADVLERLRTRLGAEGPVIVDGAFAGDEAPAGQLRSMDVVAALGEAGFVIRRSGGARAATRNAAVHGWSDEHRRPTADAVDEHLVARRDPVRVRPYEAGDESAILALFPLLFFVDRSLAHWQWKYVEHPWGNRAISVAIGPEGELLGHYAGYAVPFVDFAAGTTPRHLIGLQIGDTMTAPGGRHLGRGETGLLARVARHFYARHSRGRVAFNFGFNTANIQKLSLRYVHARRVEDVTVWARPLPLAPRPRWLARVGGWSASRVTAVDREFDAFLARVGPAYGALVARDADWLRWRYLACPDPGYQLIAVRRWGRLVGWGAFRARGETLVWGDALVDPDVPHAVHELLVAAGAAHPECRRVQGWFSLRPAWWIARLEAAGLVPEPEPNQLALMMVPFLDRDPARDLVPRLYYTQGDGDLF